MADRRARLAVARRTFAQGRGGLAWTAGLVALMAYASPAGYRSLYPQTADRLALAEGLGGAPAVRVLFGRPRALVTVEGFTAWRMGAMAAVLVAASALLATTRALRGEEDAGRAERLRAGTLTARALDAAALGGVLAGLVAIGLTAALAFTAGGLAPADGLLLAGVVCLPALVFCGVGAVAAQLLAPRRTAGEAGAALLLLAFAVRVVGDVADALRPLTWATPLGWAEEARPLTGTRPAALLVFLPATGALLALAACLRARRDLGGVAWTPRRRGIRRPRDLRSATRAAFVLERGTLIGWLVGGGAFAGLVGVLAPTIAGTPLPAAVREELARVGGADPGTPAGALSAYGSSFVLLVAAFACMQVAALRREEADGRLERLLAGAVGRDGLLARRLLLIAARTTLLALVVALAAWAGAASQGAGVGLGRMLGLAAAITAPALLFGALAALAFGLLPRHTAGLGYGLLGLAFVGQEVGALLAVPTAVLDLSPFAHLAAVPAAAVDVPATAGMALIAVVLAAAGVAAFRRRDVTAA